MREIKFKCWDKKLNKWVDIFRHKIGVQLTDVGFAMSTGYDSEDNPTWDFSKVEFNRYEYPQYTGLKDKNDKEIFEGEIYDIYESKEANTTDRGMLKYPNCEVVFDGGCFCFTIPLFPSGKVNLPMYIEIRREWVYKGNIYENKSLLK